MKILVYGPGCPRCEATETNVRRAVADLGIEAEIDHIYDVNKFANAGVMITPGVTIDGELKFHGKIPTIDELKEVLSEE
jgi:small redox-active disulfide protein 2